MNVWSISELSWSFDNAAFSWKSNPDPLLPSPTPALGEGTSRGGGRGVYLCYGFEGWDCLPNSPQQATTR